MPHAAAFRNLAHLQDSASTARVLNLLRVGKLAGTEPAYLEAPVFKSPVLNRSMIVKHRLRRDEIDLFDGRRNATKIIVPLDGADLRLGGRSVFVNQANYDLVMRSLFDEHWDNRPEDGQVLQLLDAAPSFDPFMLREQLRRHGHEPARCYFDISDPDRDRMMRFAAAQLGGLADLTYGGATEQQAMRLAGQIMSAKASAETEPLRRVLRLEPADYEEGLFCWKGFLYYRWRLAEVLPKINGVTEQFGTIRPRGAIERQVKAELDRASASLAEGLVRACRQVQRTLQVYDTAFTELVGGRPAGFREFLLGAPALFETLGLHFGAVDHILSYWGFRFPAGRPYRVEAQELSAIFSDFEETLALNQNTAQAAA